MHDVAGVKVTECHHNLRTDKLHRGLLEATDFIDVIVDVATGQVLEEEVDLELVLEHEVHRVDKRMVRLEQNVLLILDILHLLFLQKQVLIDTLHCVHFAHFAVVDKKDLTKAALVNDFVDLEILQVHLLASQAGFADEALAGALFLLFSLLGHFFLRVVLGHVRLLENDKVIKELLLVGLLPLVRLPVRLVHDKRLASIEQVLCRRHLRDAICQVTLRS